MFSFSHLASCRGEVEGLSIIRASILAASVFILVYSIISPCFGLSPFDKRPRLKVSKDASSNHYEISRHKPNLSRMGVICIDDVL